MKTYKMYIDGKWVNALSGKTYPVINPANGEQFAEAVMGGVEDVDLAVAAAKKAFPIWSAKPVAERARILKEIAAKIKEYMPTSSLWILLIMVLLTVSPMACPGLHPCSLIRCLMWQKL